MTTIEENWKDIEGYKGLYQVSNLGNARSLDREVWNGRVFYKKKGRILIPISMGNYLGVQLCDNNNHKKFYLHRLVATAFIDNPLNKEYVNHKDGNKLNNAVKNLEWCTPHENNIHAVNNGLNQMIGEENHMCKYSNEMVMNMRTDYETGLYSQVDIARKYGVSKMQTHRILTYKLRKDVI